MAQLMKEILEQGTMSGEGKLSFTNGSFYKGSFFQGLKMVLEKKLELVMMVIIPIL